MKMRVERTDKRNFQHAVLVLCLLALATGMGACKSAAPGRESRSSAELISTDTAKVSPGGATFTVPAGWSLETGKDLVVLTPPETDTHLAIFDAQAPDAAAAVKAAWAAYKGGQTHALKIVT